jgi:hypothetical protein
MAKIGIYIPRIEYISGWKDSNILNELSHKNILHIYAPEKVINSENWGVLKNKKNIIFFVLPHMHMPILGKILFNSSRIVFRNRVTTFKFSLKRSIFGEVNFLPKSLDFFEKVYTLKLNFKKILRYFATNFFQLIFFVPLIGRLLRLFLQFIYNNYVKKLPQEIDSSVDLFVLLTGNREIKTYELIKSLKSLGIPTALSIQNWDNLTSKTLILSEPDFILVMGQSCKFFSSTAQNIRSSDVITAGLPRFNPYRRLDKELDATQDGTFRILYLGTSLPHNEINLINNIYEFIETNNLNVNFSYKPHPNRRPTYFESKLNKDIKLVDSSIENYPAIISSHISILSSADLIITAPSSIVIECMLLSKNILLDLTNDGIHRTTAALAYENCLHYRGLDSISNLTKCKSINELTDGILESLSIMATSKKYDLANLIEDKKPSYSEHIANVIKLIESRK